MLFESLDYQVQQFGRAVEGITHMDTSAASNLGHSMFLFNPHSQILKFKKKS